MNVLELFAGAGGGVLGHSLLRHRTICAVEIASYNRCVLLQRQNDGILPPFPIWDDVRTFDGRPWKGLVDVVSGGFPCQDISNANTKGKGLDGKESGLWYEILRIVREVGSAFVFVENSPNLKTKGLEKILSGLARCGYDAEWMVLGADDVGAQHKRKRMWLLAYNADFDRVRQQQQKRCIEEQWGRIGDLFEKAPYVDDKRLRWRESQQESIKENLSDNHGAGCKEQRRPVPSESEHRPAQCGDWWAAEPGVVRMVHGLAHRVDRVGALGRGQVPLCAAVAWHILYRRLTER